MLTVTKFGGSSVAGAEQFRRVKASIEADPARRIVIVSAAGKRETSDHKLTDLLYLCDAHLTYGVSCKEILEEIRRRLTDIAAELNLQYDVGADFDLFAAFAPIIIAVVKAVIPKRARKAFLVSL